MLYFPFSEASPTKTLSGGVRIVAARMYWDRLNTFEAFGLHMLKL